jgi:hypothetical protein
MGRVELKSCTGGLLALDGVLTPEGEARHAGLETKAGGSVAFKVVAPPEAAKMRPPALTPADRAWLARCQALLREVRETLGEPTPSDHPVVRRGLRLLAHRYARVR